VAPILVGFVIMIFFYVYWLAMEFCNCELISIVTLVLLNAAELQVQRFYWLSSAQN
jgi:hypothetical protein